MENKFIITIIIIVLSSCQYVYSELPVSYVKENNLSCTLENSIKMSDVFFNCVKRSEVEKILDNDQKIIFTCILDKKL